MLIPPTMPPPVPVTAQAPQHSPQANAALASAMVAAQKLAKPVATQTTRAAAATGKAEASREDQSSTFSGYTVDTEAGAVRAQTPRRRGTQLNLNV
ncbi:hypothetical protein [Oleisolibacter albus]|uniref:hypothetical protein n=1 Tax=Oleisolibacter albus TaxID=2171757 RepID=UPI0012D8294D|nr:hypothetical protein [Oleisolibacter albus]